MTGKQEMLALGVRGARHKRDLMMRRYKKSLHKDRVVSLIGQQDDIVQAHLRQFKQSLKK